MVFGQFRFAAESHATRFGASAALTGAGADQLFLELGQPA
jgi:hypothetical protein